MAVREKTLTRSRAPVKHLPTGCLSSIILSPLNGNVKMSPHATGDIHVESEGTAASERDQDQYTTATYYGAGTDTLTREMVGTRYAIVVVRFFVDFSNEEDVRQVHALQDEIRFSQK